MFSSGARMQLLLSIDRSLNAVRRRGSVEDLHRRRRSAVFHVVNWRRHLAVEALGQAVGEL